MAYFTPATFRFLKDLADNNNRDWFKANQARYEEHVREPALDFITDFTGELAEISPHLVADSRKVGGSLFRIQRDTRFAKDKVPYKTNTGVQFRHELAKDAHAPGYYLNIEPGRCFMGMGLWMPDTPTANQIRHHIDANQADWLRASRSEPFASMFNFGGESLVRPPKGYPADHPLIDDLKRKSFIATVDLTQKQLTANSFFADFAQLCRAGSPLMGFLCRAVGIAY
jgi:uncharacterized protein (TIGR02453 family)